MLGPLSAAAIAFVVAVVLLAGVLTGVAGFGFALVGTTALVAPGLLGIAAGKRV